MNSTRDYTTPMTVIESECLSLRKLSAEDASSILELVNDPAWLRHIGDKRVRTLDDARGPTQHHLRGVADHCLHRERANGES